jgi:GLPGLI family protein
MKQLVIRILAVFYLFLAIKMGYSQKSGKVEYSIFSTKKTNENKKGLLIFNDSLALFSTNANFNGHVEFIFIDSTNKKNNKNLSFWGMREQPFRLLIDLRRKTIQSEQINLDSTYITIEPALKFNWSLTNDTKDILGYFCNSASTSFRGRTYKVWYTKSLPIKFGPWKTHGLPGLILEMNIDNDFVKMVATSIDLNHTYPLEIEYLTSTGSLLSIQNYIKRRENYYESFKQMMKNQIPNYYTIIVNSNDNLELH